MSKVLTIAWRDFCQTVLRKVFLIAVIGIPVLIVASIGVMVLILKTHKQPDLIGTVAVIDPSGEVATAVRREFEPESVAAEERTRMQEQFAEAEAITGQSLEMTDAAAAAEFDMGIGVGKVILEVEAHDDASPEAVEEIKARVRRGELLAVAVFPEKVLETPAPGARGAEEPRFDLYVAGGLDGDHVSFIERQLGDAVVRVRSARSGLDADVAMAMLRRPDAETRRITESGTETSENRMSREIRQQILPMIFMMLIWISTFTAANHLMMSTIEEKSNRVMEVLLSAVSPLQLMTGKILGQGGVGLLIVLIYSFLGVGSLVALRRIDLVSWLDLASLFIYFFMAYFMIASIMAAVGSAVSDIREANTLVAPVMLVVMIPLILWMPISQAPNGAIATAFSFIPPAIPFVMILRVAADEPVPIWQVPATVVWGYACVIGMIWMASKIFRVGVLMYGKPPTPVQLLKWLRYT